MGIRRSRGRKGLKSESNMRTVEVLSTDGCLKALCRSCGFEYLVFSDNDEISKRLIKRFILEHTKKCERRRKDA